MQPLDVARHEAREAGVVGQERGRVDAHRGTHALADLAQSRLVLGGGARLAALAMEHVEHVVQPGAVVALLDLVVELVELGQMQDALGEEAIRACAQGFERAGGQPRRQGLRGNRRRGRPHRLGREAAFAARVAPGAQIARGAVGHAHARPARSAGARRTGSPRPDRRRRRAAARSSRAAGAAPGRTRGARVSRRSADVGSDSAAAALRGRSESSTGIAPSERWSAPGMTTAANGRRIVRASGVTTTSGRVVPASPVSSSAAAAIGGR